MTARELLLPLAVGANAVPIIAFAPLMNNWFGAAQPALEDDDGRGPRLLPGDGQRARAGSPRSSRPPLELMRSYAAGDWPILRKVRIPNALPYFFTALKVATTLSLIGAIVGEYFGGSSDRPRPDDRAERERAEVRHHLGRDPPRRP